MKQVTIDLTEHLYKIIQIEAILSEASLKSVCETILQESIESKLDSDCYEDWIYRSYHEGKGDKVPMAKQGSQE